MHTTDPKNVLYLQLAADHGRFRATVHRTRFATTEAVAEGLSPCEIFISDAGQISDADVLAGELPPVVAQGDLDHVERVLGRQGFALTLDEQVALRQAWDEVVLGVAL